MNIYLTLYFLYSVLTFTFCSITEINEKCDNYKNLFKDTITFPKTSKLQPGDFSHVVLIGYHNEETNSYQLLCGGTIISKKYVLIPAHCTRPTDQKVNFVRVGVVTSPVEITHRDIQSDYKIANVKVHPNYDKMRSKNNIALVELEKELEFSATVRPACLDTTNNNTDNLILTEWGEYENMEKLVLDKFVVNSLKNEDCNSQYLVRTRKSVGDEEMCAINNCTGNLSGLLQIPNGNIYTVIALPSYGANCALRLDFPTVYTKIYHYLNWIENIVWS